MTSEICLMNRSCLVLAADSASTVSYWLNGQTEKRYFKGTNKIFQLSGHHPVGLMIYDSANLLNVPWEAVVKEYRLEIEDKSFNSVSGYVSDFKDFINRNLWLFPEAHRIQNFVQQTENALYSEYFDYLDLKKSDGSLEFATQIKARLAGHSFDRTNILLEDAEIDELHVDCTSGILKIIADLGKTFKNEVESEDVDSLVRFLVEKSLTRLAGNTSATGLVFAGFGDESIFPEQVHLDQCKFWGKKFVEAKGNEEKVSHNNSAIISGFAQTSMTDTFNLGISFDIFSALRGATLEEMNALFDKLENEDGITLTDSRKNELAAEVQKSISSQVFGHATKEHSQPLRTVLGVLPVDEMAELAETLINLQSLKEKVTKPSESVGGPIDVVAITRYEGLVWIKRKHFFSSDLNSRYFERAGSRIKGEN